MARPKKTRPSRKQKRVKVGYGGLGNVTIVDRHDEGGVVLIDGEDAGGGAVNLWFNATLIDPTPFQVGAVIVAAQAFILSVYISLEQFKIYSLLNDWDSITPPP